MTDFHPTPEPSASFFTPEFLNSLIVRTLEPSEPLTDSSPFDATPIIEPGCAVCRVSFNEPSRYPVKYRSSITKRFLVCWLGYEELAGYGETHEGMFVHKIVESINSTTSKRTLWVEPTRDAPLNSHWCYSGEVVEPLNTASTNGWPFGCRLQLHNLQEYATRYQLPAAGTTTKEQNNDLDA